MGRGKEPPVAEPTRIANPVAPAHALLGKLDAAGNYRSQLHLAHILCQFSRFSPHELGKALEKWERSPVESRQLYDHLTKLFVPGSCTFIFTEVGIPGDQGFLPSVLQRVENIILPRGHRIEDLHGILDLVLARDIQMEWFYRLDPGLVERFLNLINKLHQHHSGERRTFWRFIRQDICDSVELLALRICALGTSGPILRFCNMGNLNGNPFLAIPLVSRELVHSLRVQDHQAYQEKLERVAQISKECNQMLSQILGVLEKQGVDVDLVYRTERIRKSLHRIGDLVKLLKATVDQKVVPLVFPTMGHLLALHKQDGEISHLLKANLRLLARKITEGAGNTGEHYITETPQQYWKMFRTSLAAGAVTTFTLLGKNALASGQKALFVEGLLTSLVYAFSFLVLQMLGWTLATKQSSMTAAYLAKALTQVTHRSTHLVNLLQQISRTQGIAVVGNVLGIIPVVWLTNRLYFWRYKKPILTMDSIEYALKSLDGLNPSLMIFGVFTGFLLWCSSFAAGWIENLAIQRRMSLWIKLHPLKATLGAESLHSAAKKFEQNIGGWAGNISLGFLLGLAPVVSKFFGLGLEVRHVTLSTGALTLALTSLMMLDPHQFRLMAWNQGYFVKCVLGVMLIGFLNVFSSFLISLFIALRTRDELAGTQFRFVLNLIKISISQPLPFLFPVRKTKPRS
jgi:site-specific recombinase